MDKVYTVVSDRVRTHCSCGSGFAPVYKPIVKPDGTIELKQTGEKDIYAEIQSHKASTDINEIIRRFTETGDISLFQVREGVYGDFTDMPKTYAEMFQRMIDAEIAFNSLPAEVKEKFNNNVSEFLAAMGTEKMDDVFKKTPEDPAPVKEEGATE